MLVYTAVIRSAAAADEAAKKQSDENSKDLKSFFKRFCNSY